MGEVYRARDTRLGREVAVKILPDASATDPESLRRFENEARAVAGLAHPNIVPLFDFGQEGVVRYAITELVEGRTLRERLAAGPLSASESAEIAAQIAEGLDAAHARGLVHRDIKPENIMITERGMAKILDFGLARRASSLLSPSDDAPTATFESSELGQIAGTVGYMSPEQVRGEPVDARSDIFALGTVLYEMLTGRHAFSADSRVETLNAILKEDPPLPPPGARIPEQMRRILERCLAKRKESRYHSAADLAHDLRVAVTAGSSGTLALPISSSSPRRRRGAALLLLAAAGIAAVLLLWLRPGSDGTGAPRTIAVLPFRTMETEPVPHFGLGLADAVIGRLASLHQLTVRPTSAISRFETAPADAIQAGEQLGVEGVLEGRLQKLEGSTRVSVQLTDVSRRAIVWSDQLDLPEGRLFEVQDEIARKVVEKLRLKLTSSEKRALGGAQPVSDDVMEEYFPVRARLSEIIRMAAEDRRATVEQLGHILERAPNFARALGARAYAGAWTNFQDPSPRGHEAVLDDAERALVLDPDLAEPRLARAVVHWSFAGGWNSVQAVRELKAVIERKPGLDLAHLDLSRILLHFGWMENARAELDIGRRINPSSAEVLRLEAQILLYSGKPGEALAACRRMPEAARRETIIRWLILQIRLQLEDPRPLLAEVTDWAAERPPDTRLPQALLALARVRNGRKDISDLEKEIASAGPTLLAGHFHHVDHLMAEAYAQKGDAARAIQSLRRAAATGFPCLRAFETDLLIAPIRGSPEYSSFRRDLERQQEGYRRQLAGVL
jgi:TolB-like protein/tetratricopeptide (TPR) repeat protein